MKFADLYPPDPQDVPSTLTQISPEYRKAIRRSWRGILLFFLFYITLIGLLGALLWWLIDLEWIHIYESEALFIHLFLIALPALMLFLLLSFLFKNQTETESGSVELKPEHHPELFAFLRHLALTLNTPMPYKVYADNSLNAWVKHKRSSLFGALFPGPKSLTIGMGLVNSLNLSEFKALLAHEMAHLSHKSTKLDPSIYIAYGIIHQIVYFQELEEIQLATKHLGILGWLYSPLFLIRRMMVVAFRKLLRLNAGLSQQREYHADLVAVSVAGSDVIPTMLYKLYLGNTATYKLADYETRFATEKIYSDNRFPLHAMCMANILEKEKEKLEGEWLFKPNDHCVMPQMYDSHPSPFLREQSAKATYIPALTDERSAWIILGKNAPTLQKKLTQVYYRDTYKWETDISTQPAKALIEKLQQEWSEDIVPARYKGLYEVRLPLIQLPDPILSDPVPPTRKAYEDLFGTRLDVMVEEAGKIASERSILEEVIRNHIRYQDFIFRESTYPAKEAANLLAQVQVEQRLLDRRLQKFDQDMLNLHAQIAILSPTHFDTWHIRWTFYAKINAWERQLNYLNTAYVRLVNNANSKPDLTQAESLTLSIKLKRMQRRYNRLLEETKDIALPISETPLWVALGQPMPVKKYRSKQVTKWTSEFSLRILKDFENLHRVRHRNLASVLRLQEEMVAAYFSAPQPFQES